MYTAWYKPENWIGTYNCNTNDDAFDRYDRGCAYILQTYPIYDTVAILTVIIVICMVNYMMCMAAHLTYLRNREAMQPFEEDHTSTSSLSRQSSKSQRLDAIRI